MEEISFCKNNQLELYNFTFLNKKNEIENNSDIKSMKPTTHLLTNVNVFTLDSQINFLRNDIPGEIYYDLTYEIEIIN